MAGNLVQGAVFTVMVIRAEMLRDPAFADALAEQVQRSPRFFLNAPVVLDLKHANGFAGEVDFAAARQVLRRHTLSLVGIENALPAQMDAAAAAGLASFAPHATQPNRRSPPEPIAQPQSATSAGTKLVTQPVRSGTQIYARGGDLIVVGAVSPGAEIVADGNIHVYGPLRGRALAGASGDQRARIFCSRLDAELVSIAGRYLVNEQFPTDQLQQRVQIALVDERLTVTRN